MVVGSVSVGAANPPFLGHLKWKSFKVFCNQRDPSYRALARKITRKLKVDENICAKEYIVGCESIIQSLCRKGMPLLAEEILVEMKVEGFVPNKDIVSAVMLCYANNGLFAQAQAIWEDMLLSAFVPRVQVVSELMDAYGKVGLFHKVTEILEQVCSRDFNFIPEVYSLAISCFGKGGQLDLMESTLKDMISRGLPIDSVTGNAFLMYYSFHGSLTEMETAYGRLKRSRHLIENEGIRAMSFSYIRKRKFFRLGEFLRDVGLGRRNVGNLLWNLLLLSYAAKFKMKSLQREFLTMLDAGFCPDITTFNIRALAFSRMSLFWDLHLNLENMIYEKITPDLVTYGSVVDAYLDKRLCRSLNFALNRLNKEDSPTLGTDPFVFEALGKGDFHSSSEAFMEYNNQRKWTYQKLITIYLRKRYRSNQIFWNC
ncbi:hypothetical protein K2173_020737 [Erythroxylum novogranatense]|uniref:Pentatricopeptide repeat-containing protein n=1 Tax=Erythroxylum novogranatense TaxID=1862640 RepID=A0AAV8TLI8_9ROSI|nr:hypothetical protein K2173_020737 [Erythroxylum novogranatense]